MIVDLYRLCWNFSPQLVQRLCATNDGNDIKTYSTGLLHIFGRANNLEFVADVKRSDNDFQVECAGSMCA